MQSASISIIYIEVFCFYINYRKMLILSWLNMCDEDSSILEIRISQKRSYGKKIQNEA